MRIVRILLPLLIVIVIASSVWVWWNRPRRVDMAEYAPADSLLYLEANSFPQLVRGLTTTEGWRALAAPAGLNADLGNVGWIGRFTSWTGIGAADTVVYSRMQVAVVVLGLTAADGGETLNVKPRMALIVETHSSASRTLATIEKHVGNFARRAYDDLQVEKKDIDGAQWIVWSSPSSERRIISAIAGSVAIIGNDESAVRACLAVRRGDRPSLSGSLELEEMRRRLVNNQSLAFGFVSSKGAASLFEVAAAVYVGEISEDPTTQRLAANILPEIASKLIGSIGWSTRSTNRGIEDAYFIAVNNDAAVRLRAALAPSSPTNVAAFGFLPSSTYSVTHYSTRDALTAWRALSFSISSPLDPVLAVMVAPFLKATLRSYGIDEPDAFLQSIGPEIETARIDFSENSSVLVAEVRDEKALRDVVMKSLGTTTPEVERLASEEILIAKDVSRGAASFFNGYLLMGSKENVRRCLLAKQQEATLSNSALFQESLAMESLASPSHVFTFTSDSRRAREFIIFAARHSAIQGQPINTHDLDVKIDQLPISISRMKFVENGVERTTRSTFGVLGLIATQFETKN